MFGCIQSNQLKQERFILPKNYNGYCAVFYGDNYSLIDDTSKVREFRFDSTGILFTKLKYNTDGNIKLFLRTSDYGFDTLNRLIYSNDHLTKNSIYTSRVEERRINGLTKDIVIYVFYVGIPALDKGKEEFFFSKKLDSLVRTYYVKK
jgi:hypothetical protein